MNCDVLIFDEEKEVSLRWAETLRAGGFVPAVAESQKDMGLLVGQDEAIVILLGLGAADRCGRSIDEVRQSLPESQIILLVTSVDVEAASRALHNDVAEILNKSVDPDLLLQTVQKCLRKTSRQQNTQQDRADEPFLQALLDAIPTPIYYKGFDGIYRGCNRAFEKIVGFKRDQIIGRTPCDIANAELARVYQESDVELLSSGGIQVYESEVVSPDGRRYDVLFNKALFAETGEHPGGIVGTMTDISSRKQIEQQLRWSEEHFRQVFETSPDAILLSDLESGLVLEVNETFTTLSGYRLEEVVGRTSLEIGLWAVEEDRHRFIEVITDQGLIRNYEAKFRRKDGSLATGLISGRVLSQQGSPCLIAAIRDVTEIRAFEDKLQREQLRYRKLSQEFQIILESIPDSLTLWSQERTVVWTNRRARDYFLIDADRAIGQSCKSLCKLIHDSCDCPISHGFKTGENEQSVMRGQNGSSWSLKVFPIKDDKGQVVRVISLASDITESLRLREEARRTAHLAALGELAAGVAHEVNNPTGLILLNMPLVQDVFRDLAPLLEQAKRDCGEMQIAGLSPDRISDELPVVIEEVIDAARRIKEIVADLKDFAQVKDPSLYAEVDLNEVVQKALRLLSSAVRKATDHFAVEFSDPPLSARVSSQKLEQVIVNLVLNSCQALTRRDEAVAVSVYYDDKSGMNCVRVWDEGRGIAPEILAQVMDPFFTTKREEGGTGLGLSVSARIIEEFDGRLTLDSMPGQGTTATIQLPAFTQETL